MANSKVNAAKATAATNKTAVKKDSNPLFTALWEVADQLRGQLDQWEFKEFTLAMLAYRFFSHLQEKSVKLQEFLNKYSGDQDSFADFKERCSITVLGYYLPEELLFDNVLASRKPETSSKDFLQTINKALRSFFSETVAEQKESAYNIFKNSFGKIDVNRAALGKTPEARADLFYNLMNAIAKLEDPSHEHETDLLGDAFEYLMGMYASNAGKSGGEYFTPQEVSRLVSSLATLNNTKANNVYDPCCGSGSMLLRAARMLKTDEQAEKDVMFYGQEINSSSYNLCQMNLLLHGVDPDYINITLENTLTHPTYRNTLGELEETDAPQNFDVIISNPPYSLAYDKKELAELGNNERFAYQNLKSADMAFVLHCLHNLSKEGTCALVLPEGLFNRPSEKAQRQYLIDKNYIEAVVSLPSNIFFGTGTKTCILVLKKNKTTEDVVFVDLTNYVEKTARTTKGSKTRHYLSDEGIELAKSALLNRKDEKDVAVATKETIAKENYVLTPSIYTVQLEAEDEVDMEQLVESFTKNATRLNQLLGEILADLQESKKA